MRDVRRSSRTTEESLRSVGTDTFVQRPSSPVYSFSSPSEWRWRNFRLLFFAFIETPLRSRSLCLSLERSLHCWTEKTQRRAPSILKDFEGSRSGDCSFFFSPLAIRHCLPREWNLFPEKGLILGTEWTSHRRDSRRTERGRRPTRIQLKTIRSNSANLEGRRCSSCRWSPRRRAQRRTKSAHQETRAVRRRARHTLTFALHGNVTDLQSLSADEEQVLPNTVEEELSDGHAIRVVAPNASPGARSSSDERWIQGVCR